MSGWHCVAVFVLLALVGVGSSTQADETTPKLVEEHGCVACHDLREARIGPPYTAIAVRYAEADERVIERLAQKIIRGGAGNWGVVPMIPHDLIDRAQAVQIVRWILEQQAASGS